MKAGKEGPMYKNFPGAFKEDTRSLLQRAKDEAKQIKEGLIAQTKTSGFGGGTGGSLVGDIKNAAKRFSEGYSAEEERQLGERKTGKQKA